MTLPHRFLAATALACAAAVALSGCTSMTGSSPAQFVDSLANAGCTGDVVISLGAGSAAGLSPGAFHAENTFHGSCDPSRVRANVAPVLTAGAIGAAVSQAIATTQPPPTAK
jgi:hypothetical protein